MSRVCWLEDRDDALARARRLAEDDPAAALALVNAILAEAPEDSEALRAKADFLIDLGDREPAPERALPFYDRAITLLESRGPTDWCAAELAAARRGRAAAEAQRTAL